MLQSSNELSEYARLSEQFEVEKDNSVIWENVRSSIFVEQILQEPDSIMPDSIDEVLHGKEDRDRRDGVL